MARYHFLSLFALLVTTTCALGQPPVQLLPIDTILKQPPAPSSGPAGPPAPSQGPSGPPAPSPGPSGLPPAEVLPSPKSWGAPPQPAAVPPHDHEWATTTSGCAGCFTGLSQADGVCTANAEYLLWFVNRDTLRAPLFTTSAAGTDGGPSNFDYSRFPLSGARVSLGYWFSADLDPIERKAPLYPCTGVELTGFVLGRRSEDISVDGPIIIRPFLALNSGTESGLIVAAPGIAAGTLSVSENIQLWGAEANVWQTVYANPPGQTCRIDVCGGFRYLGFESDLRVDSESAFAAALPAPLTPLAGSRLDVSDRFHTTDNFYGAQVGLSLNYITPCVIMTATTKFAIGDTHQNIHISGSQARTTAGGTTTTTDAGLLALSTNSGTFDRDRIGLVPEANFKFTFPIGQQFTFYVGYTMLGWSNVARPGASIDSAIDVTRIPNFPTGGVTATGLVRPAPTFRDEFLFVHGLDLGVRFVW